MSFKRNKRDYSHLTKYINHNINDINAYDILFLIVFLKIYNKQ